MKCNINQAIIFAESARLLVEMHRPRPTRKKVFSSAQLEPMGVQRSSEVPCSAYFSASFFSFRSTDEGEFGSLEFPAALTGALQPRRAARSVVVVGVAVSEVVAVVFVRSKVPISAGGNFKNYLRFEACRFVLSSLGWNICGVRVLCKFPFRADARIDFVGHEIRFIT